MPRPSWPVTLALVNPQDSGIARLRLAMAVLAAAAAALVTAQKHLLASPGIGLVLVLVCALPFVVDARWRRLLRPGWPLTAATLVVAAGATALLFYQPVASDAAMLFFIALAGRLGGGTTSRASIPAAVLLVALPLTASALGGSQVPVIAAIGTGFAWAAGTAVRAQAQTAGQLIAVQAAATQHQIAAERQQMAREFHDLVGHTLSVTMLHMNAVRMSLEDGETGEALDSLDYALRAGREAMRQMRQTVTLLGNVTADGPPAALPHIRDLPELVAGYAAAGLKVELDADGDLTGVPGDVGLAAYRIAQESLTNAAKHAPGRAARVRIRAALADLTLMVTNDVASTALSPGSPLGPGHGIAGMTERAKLAGGWLSAGTDGGQWRVEAVLPVRERS
jgi:signal transduction histidine kinase